MFLLFGLLSVIIALGVRADNYNDPHTWPNRTLMVHLFEWKYNDIASECENFLSKYSYGAVQISPPQEHLVLFENNDYPWYVRYQPVSYKMNSRSGKDYELRDMIQRCNAVGVRTVVDVVLNHMVGIGQASGVNGIKSSGDSSFNGNEGSEQFPGVPYGPSDFNDEFCDHNIADNDYQTSKYNVKTCRLVGLLDLDQGKDYTRGKIREYLNSLISLGVAGFRVDAAKHMWPADLKAILDSVDDLRADIFGENQRPFVVNEVIDRGKEAVSFSDYSEVGRYTNFNFGADVTSAMWRKFDVADLVNMGPGYHYGNSDDIKVLNFIDNHDNQRDAEPYVMTYKDGIKYKMGVAFMLAWNYGYPRVMSSYAFNTHNQGPPNNGADSGYETQTPRINPEDETCYTDSGWVCEHRWPAIRQMAQFRNVGTGADVVEKKTDKDLLAFARNKRGYIALRNSDYDYKMNNVNTTLPAGTYCDIANGEKVNGKCTGLSISVDSKGLATFTVQPNNFVAFHLGSKL
jgi:alpha-amylase